MKNFLPFLIAIILGFSYLLTSVNHNSDRFKSYNSNFQSHHFLSDVGDCIELAKKLQLQLKNNASQEAVKTNYFKLRKCFKSAEHWIAFLDEEFYNLRLNGAPLVKIDPQLSHLDTKRPVGLQVMDEMVVELNLDKLKLVYLLKGFESDLMIFKKRSEHVLIQDRFVYESIKNQLIRIYTMGVTGFDAPGSLNSIEDAKNSIESMMKDLQVLPGGSKVSGVFSEMRKYMLLNQNFETFDRFEFYQQYIQPCINKIIELQKGNRIEFRYQVSDLLLPTKDTVSDIFNDEFFNTAYYGINVENIGDKKKVEALGKLLFYEPALSANNERSCSSCHKAGMGFSDQVKKSKAFNNKGVLSRNSPTLINAVLADKYFHDLRATTLMTQIKHVVGNDKEFNTSYQAISNKLRTSKEYIDLFSAAFRHVPQSQIISEYTINMALGGYVQSLTSFESEFDKGIRQEHQLSGDIIAGFNLFMGKANCATCHFPPTFSGLVPVSFTESESEVLGVLEGDKSVVLDKDLGRYNNGQAKERHEINKFAFKTPTIRNVELTFPYMHNGGYKTLKEVVDFYNNGGGNGVGLNLEFQTLAADSLHLKDKEIEQLIEFMNSTTDTTNMTSIPMRLPTVPGLENRIVGGTY